MCLRRTYYQIYWQHILAGSISVDNQCIYFEVLYEATASAASATAVPVPSPKILRIT